MKFRLNDFTSLRSWYVAKGFYLIVDLQEIAQQNRNSSETKFHHSIRINLGTEVEHTRNTMLSHSFNWLKYSSLVSMYILQFIEWNHEKAMRKKKGTFVVIETYATTSTPDEICQYFKTTSSALASLSIMKPTFAIFLLL